MGSGDVLLLADTSCFRTNGCRQAGGRRSLPQTIQTFINDSEDSPADVPGNYKYFNRRTHRGALQLNLPDSKLNKVS